MRAPVIVVVTTLALMVSGCGSGGSSTNSSQTASIQSGNWSITAVSTTDPNSPFAIDGSLSQSGNTISGILHIFAGCFDFSTDIPVSGTVSGQKVTLTSPVVIGEVLTVNASVLSSTALTGTYNVTANGPDCGTNDHGTFNGTLVPSISGSWHGSFISQLNSGSGMNVTANLTQSATPDAHGFFPVSGTVSFSGSTCFTAGSIVSTPLPSFLTGSLLNLNIATNDQPTAGFMSFTANADVASTAIAMSGDYVVLFGNCAPDSGTGHVNKP